MIEKTGWYYVKGQDAMSGRETALAYYERDEVFCILQDPDASEDSAASVSIRVSRDEALAFAEMLMEVLS